MESRILLQPCSHTRVSVSPAVVQDQMEIQTCWHFPVDRAEEIQKLRVPVTGITGADCDAVEELEGREQAGGSVAPVVMGRVQHRPFLIGNPDGSGPGPEPATFHPRTGPAAYPGVQPDPDDIDQLLRKTRVVRQLEGLDPVGLQSVRVPVPGHGGRTDPLHFGLRVLQWVTSGGVACRVASTISRTFLGGRCWSLGPWEAYSKRPPRPRQTAVATAGRSEARFPVDRRCPAGRSGTQDNPLGCRPAPGPRFQSLVLFVCHRQPVGRVPHEPHRTRSV